METDHKTFEPIFVSVGLKPADDATSQFLDECLSSINYLPKGKYRAGVHALLIALYEAQIATDGRSHILAAIPTTDDYWQSVKAISPMVVKTLRKRLVDAGFIKLRKRHFYLEAPSFDSLKDKSSCGLFQLNMPNIEDYLSTALVKSDKVSLFCNDKKKKKWLAKSHPASLQLQCINQIIASGLVKLSNRVVISGVRRQFSDATSSRGGRYYGPWTNQPKAMRLEHITINGSNVCEVDISSCYLRILAALCDADLPVGDLYYGISNYPREITKMLFAEMVGAGSASKKTLTVASKEKLNDAGFDWQGDLKTIRDGLLLKYPFLKNLKKGVLDSEALAYYESQIIGRAIQDLFRDHKVIALPMHDCLIVPETHVKEAQSAIAHGFNKHCSEMGWGVGIEMVTGVSCRNV